MLFYKMAMIIRYMEWECFADHSVDPGKLIGRDGAPIDYEPGNHFHVSSARGSGDTLLYDLVSVSDHIEKIPVPDKCGTDQAAR